jgi:hypothetical protein
VSRTAEAADAASLAFLVTTRGHGMNRPRKFPSRYTRHNTTPDWLKELAGEAELSPLLEAPGAERN